MSTDALKQARERFKNKDWDWISKRLLLYTDKSKADSPVKRRKKVDSLDLATKTMKNFLSGKTRLLVDEGITKNQLKKEILFFLAFQVEKYLKGAA